MSGNRCESGCRSRCSIPTRSHTFVEIDLEIISTAFFSLPLNHSRRAVVSYKRKCVHKVLFNCLFKLAQEKVWLGELTSRHDYRDTAVNSLPTGLGLQIYGGRGSLSNDLKIWPITFQGSRPSGPNLFSCEKISL